MLAGLRDIPNSQIFMPKECTMYLTLGRSTVVVDLGASVAWQGNALAIAHSEVGCQG